MVFGLTVFVLGALAYFLPSIVAIARKVRAFGGIVVVNLFLGWTLIGWVAALVWACSAETAMQAQLREMAYARMAYGPYAQILPPPPVPQWDPANPYPESAAHGTGFALGRAAGSLMPDSEPISLGLNKPDDR